MRTLPSNAMDVRVAGLRIFGHNSWIRLAQRLQGRGWVDIGRVRQRGIRIRDLTVSRLHCIIRRTSDGEYEIIDRDSTNGVLIAPQGYYSRFREVESAILHLGMIIKLGDARIAPVNAAGLCPLVVTRYSELARASAAVYGSPFAADQCTGLSRKAVQRLLEKLRDVRRAS